MIKIGDKIKIINMDGEKHYNGKVGFITFIDEIGNLHGNWGGLSIIISKDKFEVLTVNCEICNKIIITDKDIHYEGEEYMCEKCGDEILSYSSSLDTYYHPESINFDPDEYAIGLDDASCDIDKYEKIIN